MPSALGSPGLSSRLAAMRVSDDEAAAASPAETPPSAPSESVQPFTFGIPASFSQSPKPEEAAQEPDTASLILHTFTARDPAANRAPSVLLSEFISIVITKVLRCKRGVTTDSDAVDAASKGDLATVQCAVEGFSKDMILWGAIAVAAANGHVEVLAYLLDKNQFRNYTVTMTLLEQAAAKKQHAVTNFLIKLASPRLSYLLPIAAAEEDNQDELRALLWSLASRKARSLTKY